MTQNLNTQPIQCNYAVSKEYFNSVLANINTEPILFPLYLQIKINYFKVQLENDPCLPVSYHEFCTKAQPLEHIHQKRNQQTNNTYFPPENYPIIQHTDVTLNTNKTEPYLHLKQDPNFAELINTIKFSPPPMDNFIPQSPRIYNFFYTENTEITDALLYEAQQQDPVIRQLLLWKKYKNFPTTPSLTIRANKGLLHYYRRFSHLSINETNNLLYYIRETQSLKICLPLSLLLTTFHNAHLHDLSGHPGREKTPATIIGNNNILLP